MPERGFDTAFWGDPFVLELPKDAKTLFAYLWTNDHCNQAGLYYITPKTIAFYTGLDMADIPALFELLKHSVKWYPEENLVWVKNFLKRQFKSSTFLKAAAKSLTRVNNKDAIQELLDYNLKRYGLKIPYEDYMDRISLPSVSASDTNTVKGVVKREEKTSKTKGIRVQK